MSAATSIESTLRKVVELLVQKDYDGLERLSSGVRLRAAEIEQGVSEYGRTLTFPPAAAFENLDVVPIKDTSPQAYSVRFRLYTKEEGASDLEVQLTLIDSTDGDAMRVEIDGVLVA